MLSCTPLWVQHFNMSSMHGLHIHCIDINTRDPNTCMDTCGCMFYNYWPHGPSGRWVSQHKKPIIRVRQAGVNLHLLLVCKANVKAPSPTN